MSRGLSGLGVIACLCAPLGGLLADQYGWRHALSALGVFGVASLTLIALRFLQGFARCFGALPITFHHLRAAYAQLTRLAQGNFIPLGITQRYLSGWQRQAN